MNQPYRRTEDGLVLSVRVTARAKTTELAGSVIDPHGRHRLAIKLAAPPVDGAANSALQAFLAKALRVPRTKVRIESGETSRSKTIMLAGEPDSLEARFREWIHASAA